MISNIDASSLCEVCGCLSTRFWSYGSMIPICDNRACEVLITEEAEYAIDLVGAPIEGGDE